MAGDRDTGICGASDPDAAPAGPRPVRRDAPGRVVDALGRIGLVGYGVVHLLVAWLALQVAFGVPDQAPDAQGAVGTIAGRPGGVVALGVVAVGLVAFALWQLVAAALGFRWVSGGERFRKRVGAVAKAIAMAGLAAIVIQYLVGRRAGAAPRSAAWPPRCSRCPPDGSCSAWSPRSSWCSPAR